VVNKNRDKPKAAWEGHKDHKYGKIVAG